jgi:hypothetical protein
MDKKIYFIVNNKKSGSSLLRAYQIKEKLDIFKKKFISKNIRNLNINIIDKKRIPALYNQSKCICIWLGTIGHNYIKKLSQHYHILDIIDKYLYYKSVILEDLNKNIYHKLIVNNKFMKSYFIKNTNFTGDIHVIYHHWDPRLESTKTIINNKLVFGYMGSIQSLKHTDNFSYYDILVNKYPIIFMDTELGADVTKYIKNKNLNYPIILNINNIPNYVNFNCDINIRKPETDISYFKTTAKIATAAALNHNIITTLDESVKDILPINYPFILKKTDIQSINNMFKIIINDYNTDKKLWNKGLKIMKIVKKNLSIDKIILKYYSLLKNFLL